MLITKVCASCKKKYKMPEATTRHFKGYVLRKGLKIWLCKKCRRGITEVVAEEDLRGEK